jgi:hypothetical protein
MLQLLFQLGRLVFWYWYSESFLALLALYHSYSAIGKDVFGNAIASHGNGWSIRSGLHGWPDSVLAIAEHVAIDDPGRGAAPSPKNASFCVCPCACICVCLCVCNCMILHTIHPPVASCAQGMCWSCGPQRVLAWGRHFPIEGDDQNGRDETNESTDLNANNLTSSDILVDQRRCLYFY